MLSDAVGTSVAERPRTDSYERVNAYGSHLGEGRGMLQLATPLKSLGHAFPALCRTRLGSGALGDFWAKQRQPSQS
jgi:hypothetical protein